MRYGGVITCGDSTTAGRRDDSFWFYGVTNLRFKFEESRQFFISSPNETLSVAAMCVNNPDCLPLRINGWDTAPTPTGFAEIVSDDFTITSRPEGAMLGFDFAPANSALGGSESGACS
jgi:hypothetical protein